MDPEVRRLIEENLFDAARLEIAVREGLSTSGRLGTSLSMPDWIRRRVFEASLEEIGADGKEV